MRCATALRLVLLFSTAGCDKLLPSRMPPLPETLPPLDSAPVRRVPPAETTPAPPPPPAAKPALSESDYFGQIRRALRQLVVAEQEFYAENGSYTQVLERIGYRAEGGVRIRFQLLRQDGWAASGTHSDLPGRDCVIYVGRVSKAPASQRYGKRARDGVPACDDVRPAGRAEAGRPVAAATVPDTASALDAVDPVVQMRVDLRNTVLSQNAYRAAQGVYSRRFEPLALQYVWHRGVTIRILSADDISWAARAIHVARPGKSCVAWWGPVAIRPATDVQGMVPARAGVPVCDE